MPIYEYRCDACGHQEEHLQKLSEPLIASCPACNKASYRKLLSAAGFQLKGSGWYATDFKTKSTKPSEKKAGDAKPDTKPDTKPDAKPDAKPEKKTEPKSEAPA
jgi:putative FmdB family regulatory protein